MSPEDFFSQWVSEWWIYVIILHLLPLFFYLILTGVDPDPQSSWTRIRIHNTAFSSISVLPCPSANCRAMCSSFYPSQTPSGMIVWSLVLALSCLNWCVTDWAGPLRLKGRSLISDTWILLEECGWCVWLTGWCIWLVCCPWLASATASGCGWDRPVRGPYSSWTGSQRSSTFASSP